MSDSNANNSAGQPAPLSSSLFVVKAHELPSAAKAPGRWWRLSYRLVPFLLHLIAGVLVALWLKFDKLLGDRFTSFSNALIRGWIRGTLALLGVKAGILGSSPNASLLVSNHVSWLDALVVGGCLRCRFLIKKEVGDWPVIGALLRSAGSTFLARGAHQNAAVNQNLQAFLEAGEKVLIYPEATTTWGDEVSYFFPRLFACGIAAEAPVQPLTVCWRELEYKGKRYRSAAPYTDDVRFVDNIRDLLMSPRTQVELRFLTPVDSRNKTRDQLANASRKAIADSLGVKASENQKNDTNRHYLMSRLRRVEGSWKAHYD